MTTNFFVQVFFIKNFSTLNLEKKSSHLDPEIDDLTPKICQSTFLFITLYINIYFNMDNK